MVDGKSRIDKKDFWCKYQINARNDTSPGAGFSNFFVGEVLTCCAADLASGRVFLCRKSASDVLYDAKRKHGSGLSIPNDPDFEPIKEKIEYLQDVATSVVDKT